MIHVGRMAAEKNYPLLFRAYAAMKRGQSRPAASSSPARARSSAPLMRAHPDCIFAGFFSRDEIGRYYASADIYIHASLTETFGNVLTEAMASGLAAVGFDYAAARIFVQDGETGLTASLRRPEASDRGRREARHRPGVCATGCAAAGRDAVEAQSWERVIARLRGRPRGDRGRGADASRRRAGARAR